MAGVGTFSAIDMKDGSMKVMRTVSGQNTMKMEAQKKVSSSLKLLQLLPNYLDLKIKPLRYFINPIVYIIKGSYKDGSKEGEFLCHDSAGKLIKKEVYSEGECTHQEEY